MSVTMPGVTFKQFYEEKVIYHIQQSSTSSFQLESAFLGNQVIFGPNGILSLLNCVLMFILLINTYIY